jgi:transposase
VKVCTSATDRANRTLGELLATWSVEAIEALLPWNLHRQDLASEMMP